MSTIDIDASVASSPTTDESKNSIFWRGVFIWTIAALFYLYDNLLQVSPTGLKPQLSEAFNLSAGELGILSSCYLWSYGIMQIPAGLLMDTVGPRRILSMASISCAFGTLLFGFAESIWFAGLGRIFIGFGASFAVVGCSKIASVWFPPRKFALFMGLMVAIGMMGSAFGVAAIHPLTSVFGWRNAFIWGSLLGLGFGAVLWFAVRDKPPIEINKPQSAKAIPILQGLQEVVTCPQAWLAAVYAGLMFVPILAFGGLWGTPYLVEAHGFSQSDAGLLASLVFVGWAVGGPIFGWASDYMGRRNPPMYFANVTTFLVSLWLIYGSGYSFQSLAIGMFLLGFCASGFPLAYVVTREKNRPEISGTSIGFMNMMNTFSVAFFQWLIGWILDFVATDVIITSTGKEFSMLDYQKALMCIPICLIIAFLVLLRVKETYCVVKHEG